MEFKALHVPVLNQEVASRLEASLSTMPGIERLTIGLEAQELNIVFNEHQVSFETVAEAMAQAGCPLRAIGAAIIS